MDDLARSLIVQGSLDKAIGLRRRLVRQRPDDAEAHYQLGNALRRKGLLDEATSAVDIQDEPHDPLDEGNDEPTLGWRNPGSLNADAVPEVWSAIDSDGRDYSLQFEHDGYQIGRELLSKVCRRRDPDQVTIIRPGLARIGR